MTSYVAAWAQAFGVTLVVELAVAGPLLARQTGDKARSLALVTFAQILSHPAVWFILPLLGLGRATTAVSESWAVVSEALLYAVALRVPLGRAFVISLLANGASFGVGLGLYAIGVL